MPGGLRQSCRFDKPIVQAKPRPPMGCKLVGSVRGTKIWAGECTSFELKPTAKDEGADPDAVGAIPKSDE